MNNERKLKPSEEVLSESKSVSKNANVVLRPSGKWTESVHEVLTHLNHMGFSEAPRIIGTGYAVDGRETLSYMQGDMIHPAPWDDDGIVGLGKMIRSLHDAMSSFHVENPSWQNWFLHDVGNPGLISHCDISPWNVLTKDGKPCALIDWEFVGPVDPLMELARACWLFPQLVDDDIAFLQKLPTTQKRAEQVRLLCDAYGLSEKERKDMFDRILEVVVHETANGAIEGKVTQESIGRLWGFAWRARSASWILKNRYILQKALG